MQDGEAVPRGFVGLSNYVEALGSLAYMLALAIALIFALAGYSLYRRGDDAAARGEGDFAPYLLPAFVAGPSTLIFFGVAFRYGLLAAWPALIGVLLGVAGYVYLNGRIERRGHDNSLQYTVWSWAMVMSIFVAVLLTLYSFSELHSAMTPLLNIATQLVTGRAAYIFPLLPQIAALFGAGAALAAIFTISNARRKLDPTAQPGMYAWLAVLRWLMFIAIAILVTYVLGAQDALRTTVSQLSAVAPEALAEVTRQRLPRILEGLAIWEQVFHMCLGLALIGLSAYLWTGATRRETGQGMVGALGVAIALMVGGWLFIGELPVAAASGDGQYYSALLRTVAYAALTVPVQLALGLLLAHLLFNEVKRGKGLYRLIFFLPYIAPTVATAAVFSMIFGTPETSPANQIIGLFGLPAQQWLRNPKGVFQILAEIIGGPGTVLPSFLVGPSLPLLAAILYSIWVFSGYNAVVFMAGLGTVPKEVYEAAQVDGANRWTTFRRIIFPLISPTTYFLTLLGVTGTFRAFSHIWVLRTEAARGAMDTATVYIYETILTPSAIKTRPYAAALSFLLFGIILILTIVQNRYSKDRVFYG
jgi:multiple sugar transport system permease protein